MDSVGVGKRRVYGYTCVGWDDGWVFTLLGCPVGTEGLELGTRQGTGIGPLAFWKWEDGVLSRPGSGGLSAGVGVGNITVNV